MTAHVIEEYGDPGVFTETEQPVPDPAPGEIRVEVVASSVNPVDYKIRAGHIDPFAPDFPATLGCDISGVVDVVGEGVERFEAGDEVYGMPGGAGRQGALADYVVGHAGTFADAPESIPLADAAALPVVALTAWEMLTDKSDVGLGDDVLVYGASGGVGHIGVQIARWLGANVVATGSTAEKRDLALDLGADAAIDYTETDPGAYVAEHTDGAGFDTVFDPIGDDHLATAFEAVRPFGSVVTTESSAAEDLSLAPMHQQSLELGVVLVILPVLLGEGQERVGDELEDIATLVDDGAVAPHIDRRFSFSDVDEAHELAESGEFVGKILLVNE
ncbi:NADPH2:quinone reductase [Halolamina salifodinae]|uniref:NADPH2:quinone reductase n=2 Tax=Halolamina salifodinae TaxID=1202767 RepID=A0A8T4GZ07_9EURY|nr:zinc-binding dehydrogenase [Halolamina salifodinae]MBP1988247.1 NADPH2:quinone reductase [Halolamina salifodinae]